MLLLFLRHGIPLLLSLLVDRHIKELRAYQKAQVITSDGDQDLVTTIVVRCVVSAIDVDTWRFVSAVAVSGVLNVTYR